MDVEPATVAALRRFSRVYTRRLALLDEGLLKSPFSLTEARVLYELAQADTLAAADLGRELGLDAGYLSRILKRFEADGLLVRAASAQDARRADLSLTPAGRAAFAPLNATSDRQAATLLAGLDRPNQAALVRAMTTIETLLAGEHRSGEAITLRRHRVGDLGWIARRQGMIYAEEYGWDETFEALVAEILAGFVKAHDPAGERAWIAERDGAILGSVFLVRQSDTMAKLRLLYVEADARGSGLGGRLVRECIAFARQAGYRTLTLWTNDILSAARAIYQREGFRLVEEERHHSFGQDLVGQNWELDLATDGRTQTGSTA